MDNEPARIAKCREIIELLKLNKTKIRNVYIKIEDVQTLLNTAGKHKIKYSTKYWQYITVEGVSVMLIPYYAGRILVKIYG